ncbi:MULTISPECIES: peptidase inhibitor family I36 protein [Streptomyces]|uniref:Peptidase inhibitor family I36 protein n=1 Tax=Streptomyces lichenis TaxID=2306967 RepID=A0ABT0IB55_9ACTN|nr:peptidase inhibitor family I36 protein [Streptomyces lichenis]MCK8678527.1 peptidase inhibitor family I36 protein [Streptomyces lichenis]
MMRTSAFTAATAGAVIVLSAITAPAALAEPSPVGCEKEYFCVFERPGQTGHLMVKAKGNWTGSIDGQSIFNNGTTHPNADHVQVTYTYRGNTYEKCVHNNPGPGEYKMDFTEGVTFKKATWRGECGPDE